VSNETTVVNGIDLGHVRELSDGFSEAPDSGRTDFSANVRWVGGYKTETTLTDAHSVTGDEPVALAGGGEAPSPEDLLLAAVGHCLTVGWVGAVSARGYTIERLEVSVRGAVDLTAAYGVREGNPGFDRIEVEVDIQTDGPDDLPAELADRVLELAPIPNTVMRPIPVDHRLAGDG
jgi:uncharacterized OsmC-like protein